MLVNNEMSQMPNALRHYKAANRYHSRLLREQFLTNVYIT